MTGAFIFVQRGEKLVNIEVEELTNEERAQHFAPCKHEELIAWINMLCNTISKIGEQ